MEPSSQKSSKFIRDEFECFVRIGMDVSARRKVQQLAQFFLRNEGCFMAPPVVYLETRDPRGRIVDMWYLETEKNQLLRLLDFLHRFSIEEVQYLDTLLKT